MFTMGRRPLGLGRKRSRDCSRAGPAARSRWTSLSDTSRSRTLSKCCLQQRTAWDGAQGHAATQLAPDALPEEEEPVLLKCGLRDVKEGPQQLDNVRAHQPAQELGQQRLPPTVLGGGDTATPWEQRGSAQLSRTQRLPQAPGMCVSGPDRLLAPRCSISVTRREDGL